MKILKFGGTSVGSPLRMKELVALISDAEPKIVVLSAMSGTTNALVSICNDIYKKNTTSTFSRIAGLEAGYMLTIKDLYKTETTAKLGSELVETHFAEIRALAAQSHFGTIQERTILAKGELLSTTLFCHYLTEIGIEAVLLPALNFMRTDANEEPDLTYIETQLRAELSQYSTKTLFVTQGYICRNAQGEIDNLKRGGSDYTATIIGAAILATEIQIWTDIDGMHNNDPRIVDNTHPIAQLSFDEAAELAYFGAKILHPTCVLPAKLKNIPLRLLNTMQPQAQGTLINNVLNSEGIKAVAAKDGIIAIKIKSGRMLMAYGFLRSVFSVFERFKTPVDTITTSEVAVSLTIDNSLNLQEILAELRQLGTVEVDENLSIVCVVGDFTAEKQGQANRIFDALKGIPIRMISYGGSEINVSVVINTDNKNEALKALNLITN